MAKKEGPSRSADKRPPQMGNNVIWYILALGMVRGLVVSLLGRSPVEIPISALRNLISKGALAENANAAVEVWEGREDAKRLIRYSNLAEVRVGTDDVTGKISRQVLEPEGERTEPEQKSFRTGRHGVQNEDKSLSSLLEANEFSYAAEDGPSQWNSYITLLLFTVPLVVLFIVMMRRMGGAGSPMAFGRSRGKLYAQEDIDITFDDVAGIDEAVEELREVVEFLQDARKVPGASAAASPRACCWSARPAPARRCWPRRSPARRTCRSSACRGSDFVEMFVGVGAAARPRPVPAGRGRGPRASSSSTSSTPWARPAAAATIGGHDEREQTLNQLLVEMDGFGSNSGVIVMAATNRPETLDPALLRPGRFDRHVVVDRPDINGREAILQGPRAQHQGRTTTWTCRHVAA